MLMKEVKEVVDTVSVALANGQPEEAGNVVMQEVNHALLSMGVDEAMADKIDNFIILLFIIGIALLANLICRKIILRTVAKLVRQTKATWDDIVFNDKVMVNISRMVAPILIYISIPIAFPEHADSALLDFLRRLCMIYILAVFLRFVSALFTAVYLVYSAREQYKDKPLKGLLQTAQVILFFIGAIIIISILIKQSPVVLLTGLGMQESGGRRVKRSINIDMTSVHFCTPEMLAKYRKIQLLKDYVDETEKVVEEYNKEHHIDNSVLVNGRRQTNLGVFRAYLTNYLKNLPTVNQDLTCMVRQLQPTETGIPLELYFFSANKVWVAYEGIQADVFDHVLAIIPEFDLRVFQNPSGADLHRIGVKIEN